MVDLRKLARGQPCMIRIPGICNRNPETTVLAHYRLIGVSGMGMKSPDTCAAWACSSCHEFVDTKGKNPEVARTYKALHLEGVIRTLNELDKLGYSMSEAERV